MELKQEFPCGYKIEFKISAWQMIFCDGEVSFNNADSCPIHGKNCRRLNDE
jgi:hypothetical protein